MEKSPEPSSTQCLNCGATVTGEFCHECGQRVRDNLDRSLGRLIGEFLGNIFFLDNRFILSVWYLIRYPSRMTVEFLEGKRKKFISPVTLFLFFNLVYFIVSPLSDYSISLYDQTYSQPYSGWIQEMVRNKLEREGLDFQAYGVTYQHASDNISKSVMILNIPMIALMVFLITFKQRKFYFDSLIFVFHFFSLFMLSWVLLDWVGTLLSFFSLEDESAASAFVFLLFTFLIPLTYAILGHKKFLAVRWYLAVPAGLATIVAVGLSNLVYRLIIFFLTFWTT